MAKARTQLISVKDEYDDVWEVVNELKKDKKNVSEFVCRAMRFYIKHKNKLNTELTEERVRELIKEEFEKLLVVMEFKKKDDNLNIDFMINDSNFEAAFSSFNNSDDEE